MDAYWTSGSDQPAAVLTAEKIQQAMAAIRERSDAHLRERAERGHRFWSSLPEGFVESLSGDEALFVSAFGEVVASGAPMHPRDAKDAQEHLRRLVDSFERSASMVDSMRSSTFRKEK